MQDFDGANVVDSNGEKIGTVERSYDDDEGNTRFVAVSMGSLFWKEQRFVPVDAAQLVDHDLQVPFSKQVIDGSPDASGAGDTLEGELLDTVRAYYRGDVGTADQSNEVAAVPAGEGTGQRDGESEEQVGASEPAIGAVRDLGDVIEVPIVEEELVKQPVVKEVLRIRKTPQTEQRSVGADVRKEDMEVVQEGDIVVHDETGQST